MDPYLCPDPLAERRYAYARAAAQDGDWQAAAEVLEQALERAPAWAPALFSLAEAREKLGDARAAASAYAATLRADPADAQGAGPRLARLEQREVVALPPAYVARLFDDYAPRFDQHLRETLAYRGPELIVEAIDAVAPERSFALALDLGCGSGLAGRAIRDRVAQLEGVDLSPRMIEKARASGVYEALEVGDLVGWLEARAAADLVVAADTLVYLGDLRPVVAAVAGALAAGGLFAFTVESGEAAFTLGEGLRFRHSDAHIREAASVAGLALARLEPASTRREAGGDAPGRVVALAKR
jgi:predicted TPR repeat methyltransferase